MPITDGHRVYPCRTAFWEKNQASARVEYIHRTEFEQTFVALNNEMAALRDEKDEYRSKYYRALHNASISRKSTADIRRLSDRNRKLNWTLERLKSETKKEKRENENRIARLRRESKSSRSGIKDLNDKNCELTERNSFLQRQLKDIKERYERHQCANQRSHSENCKYNSMKNHIGNLRKHDNKKKKWHENRLQFYRQELKEMKRRNARLTNQLSQRQNGRSLSFSDRKESQKESNVMKRRMEKILNVNETLMEEVQMLQDHSKYSDNDGYYPLFVQMSHIVAKLRSQHRIYRNKTDDVLLDIRKCIDEATKESKNKQRTLENILRRGSPMKGGKKGTMVRENRDHTEYLGDVMRKLHEKVHNLFRINREDERNDRLGIKLKVDSILKAKLTDSNRRQTTLSMAMVDLEDTVSKNATEEKTVELNFAKMHSMIIQKQTEAENNFNAIKKENEELKSKYKAIMTEHFSDRFSELKKLTSQIEKAKSEMYVQTTRLRAKSVSDKYRSKSAKVTRRQKLRTEHYGKNKNKDKTKENEMLTSTNHMQNISSLMDSIPFESDEKQDSNGGTRRLSEEDAQFLHNLHLFIGNGQGSDIDGVMEFVEEHHNDTMVIHL